MQVQAVPIAEVIPYHRNPRKNDAAVSDVARSLQEFGWQQPIVVDKKMVVIVGHTRLRAAHQLGMPKVPVVVATNLSAAKVRQYRLADNKSGERAQWDDDLLSIELGEMRTLGIDLEPTTFTADELKAVTLGAEGEKALERQSGQRVPNAVLSYSLVFESADQQKAWFDFIRYLRKTVVLDKDATIAARLAAFLKEHGYQ